MNVKSVANTNLNIDNLAQAKGKERVKTFESSDRDADGKQQQSDKEPERELSEEEIQQAINAMQELPAVKTNDLKVQLDTSNAKPRILVLSPEGELIKSLTPFQALKATENVDEERPKGQLLNKAM